MQRILCKRKIHTYFFLYFILFLFAEGSLCHCHLANAERLQFALKQRLYMSTKYGCFHQVFNKHTLRLFNNWKQPRLVQVMLSPAIIII